jgi:hypothetical protein
LLDQAIERGFYPHDYIAVHCPFLTALRGSAEFERIVARDAERVAASSARGRRLVVAAERAARVA